MKNIILCVVHQILFHRNYIKLIFFIWFILYIHFFDFSEIASRGAHGLEADVWSLGCMMYTFLTGKPPFDTDGIRNTLNKVVLAEYEMPQHISNEAQDLIKGLLQKGPQDRIALTSKFYNF
jgi:serine/threonine protein kinase